MKPKSTLRHFLALAGSSVLAISSSHAATVNWDGDTSTDWADAANWNTLPTNDLLTDIANFNLATYGGGVFAPTVGTATSIKGITIGALNGAMTLTNTAALSIGASGIAIANGAGAFTISGSTTVGATQSWTNNSGNLFTFGAVAVTGGLTIGGTGNNTSSGSISGVGLTLIKTGSGTLSLTGTSSITNIDIQQGVVEVSNVANANTNSSMGKASGGNLNTSLKISNGATLRYVGSGHSTNRSFQTAGSGAVVTLDASGTGAINFTNGVSPGATGGGVAATIQFAGTNTGTNTFSGAVANNGAGLRSIAKIGTGTWVLNGNSTYTGGTTLNQGTLTVGTGGTLGAATGVLSVNNTNNTAPGTNAVLNLATAVDTITGSLSGTIATPTSGTNTATINIASGRTFTVNQTANGTYAGVIAGSGGNFTLGASSTQTLTLTGTNTYTGATTISAGTLKLGASGSIANSATVIVGASTTFDVSAVTGGYTLGGSQTLSGTGTVVGAMSVSGTLSPGNSPGIQTTGNQTWVNGGDYNFQMLDATGPAGSTGFDQIQITGTLDLTSLTAAGFAINLWSLSSTGPDVDGNALNFNNAINKSWTILTTTGGISGFELADFTVNVGANNGTGGFSNALGGGSFSIDATSNNLVLNYTAAIPEPRAALLGGLGLLMLLRRRRS